jgi:hypothetical protein
MPIIAQSLVARAVLRYRLLSLSGGRGRGNGMSPLRTGGSACGSERLRQTINPSAYDNNPAAVLQAQHAPPSTERTERMR